MAEKEQTWRAFQYFAPKHVDIEQTFKRSPGACYRELGAEQIYSSPQAQRRMYADTQQSRRAPWAFHHVDAICATSIVGGTPKTHWGQAFESSFDKNTTEECSRKRGLGAFSPHRSGYICPPGRSKASDVCDITRRGVTNIDFRCRRAEGAMSPSRWQRAAASVSEVAPTPAVVGREGRYRPSSSSVERRGREATSHSDDLLAVGSRPELSQHVSEARRPQRRPSKSPERQEPVVPSWVHELSHCQVETRRLRAQMSKPRGPSPRREKRPSASAGLAYLNHITPSQFHARLASHVSTGKPYSGKCSDASAEDADASTEAPSSIVGSVPCSPLVQRRELGPTRGGA